MTFWLLAGGLSALAIALLLWPLLRRPAGAAPRQVYDRNVYRDQLAEVEREAAEGNLGAEQADAARAEIEHRLLATAETGAEMGAETVVPAPDGPGKAGAIGRAVTWSLALALGIAIPLGAIGLYLQLGNPGVPSLPFGGVKQSGVGTRHGGAEGFLQFCVKQSVMIERRNRRRESAWFPYHPKRALQFEKLLAWMFGR